MSAPTPGLRKYWIHVHLLWEAARPYLYVRTTPDDRVVVGGADEDFADEERRDALIPRKLRQLRERFVAFFPETPFRTAFAGAGTFGETPDGMGYVGTPRRWRHAWFVLAFGGNGIAFGVTAAEIVAAKARGEAPRDEMLFAFDR